MNSSRDKNTLPSIFTSKSNDGQSKRQTSSHGTDDELNDIRALLTEEIKSRQSLEDSVLRLDKRFESLENLIKNHLKITPTLPELSPEVAVINSARGAGDVINQRLNEDTANSTVNRGMASLRNDLQRLWAAVESSKLANDRVTEVLSANLASQGKDINELKSVVSAEITARRKFQDKTGNMFQKLAAEHEHDAFTIRKDILHLSESLGSRMSATESSAAIHRETMISQIANSRNLMTDNINVLRNDVEVMKRENEHKYRSLDAELKSELKLFENSIRALDQNARTDKFSDQLSHISSLANDLQVRQERLETTLAAINNKPLIEKEYIENLLVTKWAQQDKKLRRTFDQVFKDMSDEIVASVRVEADERARNIHDIESKLSNIISNLNKNTQSQPRLTKTLSQASTNIVFEPQAFQRDDDELPMMEELGVFHPDDDITPRSKAEVDNELLSEQIIESDNDTHDLLMGEENDDKVVDEQSYLPVTVKSSKSDHDDHSCNDEMWTNKTIELDDISSDSNNHFNEDLIANLHTNVESTEPSSQNEILRQSEMMNPELHRSLNSTEQDLSSTKQNANNEETIISSSPVLEMIQSNPEPKKESESMISTGEDSNLTSSFIPENEAVQDTNANEANRSIEAALSATIVESILGDAFAAVSASVPR